MHIHMPNTGNTGIVPPWLQMNVGVHELIVAPPARNGPWLQLAAPTAAHTPTRWDPENSVTGDDGHMHIMQHWLHM